ncbi:lysylphosphatidylglycerol synthase transmembrane domain-containing protein [Aliterella atlantica]|uniref:Integral membrane protein n=1 Tax=Aliterella atlantica CENA595 TaxID=1618023 RepID=A0A0D8ZQ93_9CYAN|nr:YbhN family protein [Aliterella atlantica]KJH70517.1 integral membrane protein [Aliterella atlantica CENA595]
MQRFKPFLRWLILGGVLFFLAQALKANWQEVAAIQIKATGWAYLGGALAVTLLAHIWTGWVWGWILQFLNYPVKGSWAIRVYLKTNIAKYVPGNVWHFYGRIKAATAAGVSTSIATLSVLLEPLLMAAAALVLALLGTQQASWGWQVLGLAIVLIAIHPAILNRGLKLIGKMKGKDESTSQQMLKQYPLLPLLGELGFLGLRGAGFILTVLALYPVEPKQILILLSAFSLAWLLGLVVPGAPGGIGVFEATAIALLSPVLSPGIVLSAVAVYRLISILAEAVGAGIAWIWELKAAT